MPNEDIEFMRTCGCRISIDGTQRLCDEHRPVPPPAPPTLKLARKIWDMISLEVLDICTDRQVRNLSDEEVDRMIAKVIDADTAERE